MKQIIDTDDPDESVGPDAPTPDHAADTTDLLFPGYCTPGSIDQFHPEPVHALRLWQIFLDRVNPLTKIIHVPSLQPHLVEAATDPNAVPIKYQALLFSIYLMASIALSEDECAQVLGVSKHEAIRKFTSATRHALIQFDFLRNYDMASLQALVFFLVCFTPPEPSPLTGNCFSSLASPLTHAPAM